MCKVRTFVGACSWDPLTAAATEDRQAYVAAQPTSPCSQVLPGRRGGPPSGDLTAPPALSLRAEVTEPIVPPPCTGETREENSPSRVVIVGDEGTLTILACATEYSSRVSANPRPKDVARGFVLGPLTLDRDLNCISQPIRDRQGCMSQCVCVTLPNSEAGGHCPTRYSNGYNSSGSSHATIDFKFYTLYRIKMSPRSLQLSRILLDLICLIAR